MTITNMVNCKVLGIVETVGKDNKKYYKLSILLPDYQSGMISISDAVVQYFHDGLFNPMDDVTLECVFNDAYGSYKACRIFKSENKK